MNTNTALKLQAYLDDELSPRQRRSVERLLDRSEEAREFLVEMGSLQDTLRSNEPAPALPEDLDFYLAGIRRRLEAEIPASRVSTATVGPASWLIRYFAPIGAAAAVIAMILIAGYERTDATRSAQTTVEAPNVITFQSEDEDFTILWIDSEFE